TERGAGLLQHPLLDVDGAVFEKLASCANNVVETLRPDLELAEAGANLLGWIVRETTRLAGPSCHVPALVIRKEFEAGTGDGDVIDEAAKVGHVGEARENRVTHFGRKDEALRTKAKSRKRFALIRPDLVDRGRMHQLAQATDRGFCFLDLFAGEMRPAEHRVVFGHGGEMFEFEQPERFFALVGLAEVVATVRPPGALHEVVQSALEAGQPRPRRAVALVDVRRRAADFAQNVGKADLVLMAWHGSPSIGRPAWPQRRNASMAVRMSA